MITTRFYFLFFLFISFFSNLSAQEHQRFIVVTPEKTGTHLLTKLISRLINKEVYNCWDHSLSDEKFTNLLEEVEKKNMFLHTHIRPKKKIIQILKKKKYKVIFLMRDPRDVMISLLYYIEKGWAIGPCSLNKPYGLLSLPEKLHELITGKRYGVSMVNSIILRRLDWMKQEKHFIYTAHFENLVGAEGGGNDKKQLKEIIKISKHLNLNCSLSKMQDIAKGLWGAELGEKTTFRQGQLGSWKQEFNADHRAAFKKLYGKLLIHLKYEKNTDW